MEKGYIDLVRLLIDAAPAVFEGDTFALKGGTAINLFVTDMPSRAFCFEFISAS